MVRSSRVSKQSTKSSDKEDRISALPDSIVQHILSFLPSTDEAVKTSFLSKRWRNQWTHVLDLVFEPFLESGDDYCRFIENTLILHDSPKIKKFHLEYDSEWEVDPRFTSKLRFATRKCVEELILICHCDSSWYLLPEFMFYSASLVRLEMVNCHFMPNWRVNWPSLKALKIDCARLGLEDKFSLGIENVVSGSPSLEWMEFRGYIDEGAAIVSDSLKVLSFVDAAAPANISCPNLVEFNMVTEEWYAYLPDQMIENVMSGSPFIHSLKIFSCAMSRKLVVASKSLKVLHLEHIKTPTIQVSCPSLEKLDVLRCGEVTFQALNVPSSICATIDAYDPRCPNFVNELLVQFRHVNELQIGRSLFKAVLSLDMEGQLSLPLLNNKWLTLNACYDLGFSIPGIAYALRSPILETLVINVPIMYYQQILDKDLQDYWNSNGYTGLTCLESHLKTVKIIGLSENDANCKLALEFIEFLLMNAKVLKKMIVVLESPGPSFAFEVSQKLLSFPRYSKCACIELSCST